MSVIRVGSTSTYAEGWEQIFGGAGGKPGRRKTTAKRPAKQAGPKKAAAVKKPAARKAAAKKGKSRGR